MAQSSNIQAQKLIQLLNNKKPFSLQKQNVLEPAAKVYFVILSMFQTYKKKHQFQLLQQKIHQIKISQTFSQNQEKNKVLPEHLCQYSDLNFVQILNLIKILNQITQNIKGQLITEIVFKINNLTNINEVMKCFQKLLCSDYCLNIQICKNFVEEKMISKLLSTKLKSQDFKTIAKYLPVLPNISGNILYFVGLLFNKVQKVEDFDDLYKIFIYNIHHEEKKMEKKEIQTLMKINNPKALQKIQTLIKLKNEEINKIAQNQAKQKLLQMDSKFKQKNKLVIAFIILVIKSDINLWEQIYSWESNCFQQNLKQQFFEKLSNIFQGKNIQKIQKKLIFNLEIIKDFDEKSMIHNVFLNYILLSEKKSKSFIKRKLIMQYISKKIVCISKKENFLAKFFSTDLQFLSIILKSLQNDQKICQFFKILFINDKSISLFSLFLQQIKRKNPVKFKDFFVKIDRLKACDLFFIKKSIFFDFVKNMQIEIAVDFIRDLSFHPPSKNIVLNIINLMDSFKEQKHFYAFVSTCARTLNILLIRTPANQLCNQFKIYLPKLAQKIKGQNQKFYKILFSQVSQETNTVLRNSFAMNRTLKL